MMRVFKAAVPLLCFLLLLVFFWRGLSLHPRELPSTHIGKPLPELALLTAQGEPVVLHAGFFAKHRFTLLNVWASWCQTCMEEQVFLLALARERVAIVGLNYKDTPKQAREWLKTWGNPFEAVFYDPKGKASALLGVYGTPETYLLDAKGRIVYRHVGALTKAVWQQDFKPLLESLT